MNPEPPIADPHGTGPVLPTKSKVAPDTAVKWWFAFLPALVTFLPMVPLLQWSRSRHVIVALDIGAGLIWIVALFFLLHSYRVAANTRRAKRDSR